MQRVVSAFARVPAKDALLMCLAGTALKRTVPTLLRVDSKEAASMRAMVRDVRHVCNRSADSSVAWSPIRSAISQTESTQARTDRRDSKVCSVFWVSDGNGKPK